MKRQFTQLLQGYIHTSGVKRVHVASVAGISYNYLSRLLAGTRKPSDQVVYKLAQALHLTREQTSELLSSAGFLSFPLQVSTDDEKSSEIYEPASLGSHHDERNQASRLAQQFYRLALEVPENLQNSLLEEMRCLLNYARYKYLLNDGAPLLDLHLNHIEAVPSEMRSPYDKQTHLDMIAQIVGELYLDADESVEKTSHVAEDTLFTIDHLIGNLFSGEISITNYHPQLVTQVFDILRDGTPWEIRRRIAEALPSLCRLDVAGAERLMESLRMDLDEICGPDIRRRVVEALPALFDSTPQSFPVIIRLLEPHTNDDIYVALATIEVCGDIQVKSKALLAQKDEGNASDLKQIVSGSLPKITMIQRQILMNWADDAQESLQFSMALHNLLQAPDTLLISLEEGLKSENRLIQLVAARYLERILLVRPIQALELYQLVLRTITTKNIRRSVAKALPVLLECLKKATLPTRALVRAVILALVNDPDILIRRAVADHAMQIFHIDREFLLMLLKHMHKETDQAIRIRLRPVALRLAQVWLIWYAETARLVSFTRRGDTQAINRPFGE
jgi:transcriptional regulator with XRE-family HTH domain/HEAT repeat protein